MARFLPAEGAFGQQAWEIWMRWMAVSAAGLLAACGTPGDGRVQAPETAASPVPAPSPASGRSQAAVTGTDAPGEAAYLGRWTGVEGTFLEVRRKPGGGLEVENQWDLDHRRSFEGSVTAEGLRFMRNGVAVAAVPGNGDATGMKWLAGKQDCLIVQQGEGYCRD